MKRELCLLGLVLSACAGPARSSEPPAVSSGAETASVDVAGAVAPTSASTVWIGRWDGAAGARALHLVLTQAPEGLTGQLDIRHEAAGTCQLAEVTGSRDATHLPVRFNCSGPDSEDGSDPPYWEGTTDLSLAGAPDSLSADFGFGPVALTRAVLPDPPSDNSTVSLAPFLGQRYGVSEIADYEVSTAFEERDGRLAGGITLGFSDVVECTVSELPLPRAPGRIALHEICDGGLDHEYAATRDCTIELLPDGHVTSDDCWEMRTEVAIPEE